jgi:hypothetical protein
MLAPKGSLELTLSTQLKDKVISTNLTRRGWGEPLSFGLASNGLGAQQLH